MPLMNLVDVDDDLTPGPPMVVWKVWTFMPPPPPKELRSAKRPPIGAMGAIPKPPRPKPPNGDSIPPKNK